MLGSNSSSSFQIYKTATAFRGATITWKLQFPKGNSGPEVVDNVNRATLSMKDKLDRYRGKVRAIEFNQTLPVIFEQVKDPSIIREPAIVLVTEQFEAYPIQIFSQFSKLVPTSRWTASPHSRGQDRDEW